MGKREDALIEYYNDDGRFAQLANEWLFGGADFLKAGDFSDGDRRQECGSGHGRRRLRHRYRDIFKETETISLRLLIGAELQEHVDYAMPLRVMDMDVLAYLQQKKKLSAGHKLTGYRFRAEYLSGFSREDRLTPVVTLVLYLGKEPWDGARSLHELLDFSGFPEELKRRVTDYGIDVLDVRHAADDELKKFPPDIRFMLLFIKYSEDKEAIANLKTLCGQETVSRDTFEALANYTDEEELLEWAEEKGRSEEGGGVNMCGGIRALVEEGRDSGRREGRIEGRKEGRVEGKTEGQERVNSLIRSLLAADRMEDIRRAVEDPEYQQELFEELGI
ncbi:MAG: Rpn family recombination-promoting nuclease/putative transposase [Eubacteriales bacterium]|nr:Rpn family recombination-promoting nuclease/putative transposase [Eubacteriales bacterium]